MESLKLKAGLRQIFPNMLPIIDKFYQALPPTPLPPVPGDGGHQHATRVPSHRITFARVDD